MKLADADMQSMLVAQGLRVTKQRRAVADVLREAVAPLEAKEIYRRLVHADVNTGFATVYRTLAVLEKAGIIVRMPQVMANSAQYHLPDRAMSQVVCSRCGKVEEIEVLPEMRQLSEAVSRQSGFATVDQSLYIFADCRNVECD